MTEVEIEQQGGGNSAVFFFIGMRMTAQRGRTRVVPRGMLLGISFASASNSHSPYVTYVMTKWATRRHVAHRFVSCHFEASGSALSSGPQSAR